MAKKKKMDHCYECGRVRCNCELPKVSVRSMKQRVRHSFVHGYKRDRDACTYEELAALLKMIPDDRKAIRFFERLAFE